MKVRRGRSRHAHQQIRKRGPRRFPRPGRCSRHRLDHSRKSVAHQLRPRRYQMAQHQALPALQLRCRLPTLMRRHRLMLVRRRDTLRHRQICAACCCHPRRRPDRPPSGPPRSPRDKKDTVNTLVPLDQVAPCLHRHHETPTSAPPPPQTLVLPVHCAVPRPLSQ